jgi:hypothetical protein
VEKPNYGGNANVSQSASPSSTLPPGPALLTPVSSTGYAEQSSAGMAYPNDHHGINSPRSISGSATSAAYNAMNIPARVLSPHDHKSMASQGGPPDLRVAVAHNPHEPTSHWQQGGHHLQGSQQYQQLQNQSARSSWDMSPYLEGSPATSAGTSGHAQALQAYPNSRSLAEASVPGGDNRIVQSLSSQQQSQQVPRS